MVCMTCTILKLTTDSSNRSNSCSGSSKASIHLILLVCFRYTNTYCHLFDAATAAANALNMLVFYSHYLCKS